MSYQDNESLEKAIKARINMINDDIKGNLAALSLEDNFDQEEVAAYMESTNLAISYVQNTEQLEIDVQSLTEDAESRISATASGLTLKVRKGDVVTQLNAESTGLYFSTKKFLVDTPNFKVTENSCYCNGTVNSDTATIGGWTFASGTMSGNSSADIYGGTVIADAANCSEVSADNMWLNTDPEADYRSVNMKNATFSGDLSGSGHDSSDRPNFGDVYSRGPVTLNQDFGVYNEDFNCTSFTARGTSGYISIYCEEIVTATESWSDKRLKENIYELTEEEAKIILKLEPVKYKMKESGQPATGFIAQDVLEVLETDAQNAIVSEQKGLYSITYRQLIPYMIRQIQVNNEKLRRLKCRA